MLTKTLPSVRAAGAASARLLLICCAALAALHTASAQPPGKSRITTASGVRVRSAPQTTAEEVGRLPLGAVVRELERSAERARVGDAEDYWFRVSAPGGVEGWVFGGLTAAFDPSRPEAAYRQLAASRVENAAATFAELSDLVTFLDRAAGEVSGEARAELELARLVALQRSLASIDAGDLQKEPYAAWVKAREPQIVYSEPAGQWFVRAEQFWDLQQKYKDLPVGERIAWEGSQIPLPGECEGYLPCNLYNLLEREGRYLKLYPRGAHAADAVKSVEEFLSAVVEDLRGANPVYNVPAEDRADFRKGLAQLRALITPVSDAARDRVLAHLDELDRRFK